MSMKKKGARILVMDDEPEMVRLLLIQGSLYIVAGEAGPTKSSFQELYRLARKAPDQVPANTHVVVAAPFEQAHILQHRTSLTHQLEYVAAQALNAWLDRWRRLVSENPAPHLPASQVGESNL